MLDLRWYQHDACNAAWHDLCANAGNSVIVAPTGSGKSLLIAELARRTVEAGYRVLVLAHRAELLVQNADKLRALLPWNVRVGIFSAGLNQRATDEPVICAGIQSVHKRASEFGARHLVLLDEAHTVPFSGEGMYRSFIADLRAINPKLRMIGLTATPYRTDNGKLCRDDGLFQRVCYDIPVRKLIDEGWLCGLTNQPTETVVDTAGLHVRGGEFVAREMEDLFDGVIGPACQEIVSLTPDRKSVLVFCSGVEHARHVRDLLEKLTGETVGLVTGETLPIERASQLEAFKAGRLRMLCSVECLTTGFDAPGIDCIAVLRATMSPGLFAQIVGRGLRTSPSKTAGCLVLDFGNNIERHGAIDDPEYGKKKDRTAQPGEAPEKTCPNCGESLALGCLLCEHCGFAFPPREKSRHESEADHENEILNNAKPPEWFSVREAHASLHVKKKGDGPPTLRVDYEIEEGNLTISEWICLEHDSGYARAKAVAWWVKRCVASPPMSIDEAVNLWHCGALAVPRRIQAKREGRFWRVLEYEFDEAPPETWSDEPVATCVPFDAIDDDDLPF